MSIRGGLVLLFAAFAQVNENQELLEMVICKFIWTVTVS